ncbi:MAG: EsaB/YukD family protein [Firmicutes bacterium]|nr:EsaB/YukD family protein [Bacillota bacterium]
MPEKFIVTVACDSFTVDLEIPSGQPVGEFRRKLLEILQSLGGRAFPGMALSFNGRAIPDSRSLADVGAFDGSIIEVTRN